MDLLAAKLGAAGGEAACHFGARARLYESLHDQFRHRTRFFAAAAWTNRVLRRLAEQRLLCPCSAASLRLLSALGHTLQHFNIAVAASLARSPGCIDIDRRLVRMEQRTAENFLSAVRREQPEMLQVFLREMDALLNRRWRALLLEEETRAFEAVLHSVRRNLNARLTFADQQHREAIGEALIASL